MIQCVLTNRDVTEMSVLSAALLSVCVLIYQYHRTNWLCEEVVADEYRLSAWKKGCCAV